MTIENFLINLIKPFIFFFYTLNMLDEIEKVTKGYKSYKIIKQRSHIKRYGTQTELEERG